MPGPKIIREYGVKCVRASECAVQLGFVRQVRHRYVHLHVARQLRSRVTSRTRAALFGVACHQATRPPKAS
jgi:hypothetical protein